MTNSTKQDPTKANYTNLMAKRDDLIRQEQERTAKKEKAESQREQEAAERRAMYMVRNQKAAERRLAGREAAERRAEMLLQKKKEAAAKRISRTENWPGVGAKPVETKGPQTAPVTPEILKGKNASLRLTAAAKLKKETNKVAERTNDWRSPGGGF